MLVRIALNFVKLRKKNLCSVCLQNQSAIKWVVKSENLTHVRTKIVITMLCMWSWNWIVAKNLLVAKGLEIEIAYRKKAVFLSCVHFMCQSRSLISETVFSIFVHFNPSKNLVCIEILLSVLSDCHFIFLFVCYYSSPFSYSPLSSASFPTHIFTLHVLEQHSIHICNC